MWMGTPARFSYWIDKHMNKINFDDHGVSKCKKFELVNNKSHRTQTLKIN